MKFDYDLFVIGGGSGGVRAARVAAKEGVKVGIAEGDRYGGTCVIRGCVPKKLMVYASEFSAGIDDLARGYGWTVPETVFQTSNFSWKNFQTKMFTELSRLELVYENMLKSSGVTTYSASAQIIGHNQVLLSTGEVFNVKCILIATGGEPFRPDIPGAELALLSDDIFSMKSLPSSILIVGGGYIACEFACILNGLGTTVTQFHRGQNILRGFDHDLVSEVSHGMLERGVNLKLNTSVLEISKQNDVLCVRNSANEVQKFEKVLFATGRVPKVHNLGLESVGIQIDKKGAIVVDEYSRTNCPHIYAVGDVTNRMNLTPVAIREAMAFVETVFKGNPTKMEYDCIPTAVFTQPEVGTVGLSEHDARSLGPVQIYKTKFNPMHCAFAGKKSPVLLKLVVCSSTRVVLGCHFVAPRASELIQMVAVALKMRATKEDFDKTVAVHPTFSEELVTLRTPEN